MARRMESLRALARGEVEGPAIVLATAASLLRRVPGREALAGAAVELAAGQELDPDALRAELARLGHVLLPEADEPGEAMVNGTRLRIHRAVDNAVVLAEYPSGRTLDKLTLDGEPVERVTLGAASELLLDTAAARRFEGGYAALAGPAAGRDPVREGVAGLRRPSGVEHWLPLFHDRMDSLFDLLPGCPVSLDERAEGVRDLRLAEITEAHRRRQARMELDRKAGLPPYPPVPVASAFLGAADWDFGLATRKVTSLDDDPPETGRKADDRGGRHLETVPDPDDLDGLRSFLEGWRKEGRRLVAAVSRPSEALALARLVGRRGLGDGAVVKDWAEAQALPPGTIAAAVLPLESGFTAPGIGVLARTDLLKQGAAKVAGPATLPESAGLALGALVVHPEHGVALADGLEAVQAAGAPHDCLKLVYKDGDSLFVPVENLDLLHPAGPGAGVDKLGGQGWANRLDKAKAQAEEMARALLEAAARRKATRHPPIKPPRRAWRAFLSGFPYELTPDQETTIDAVLADLAAGHTMDRLVVGDVGVGKTEVALRAAFAVAMSGRQVAVVAPTSPLARQHLEDFADRFAGFPVSTGYLGRGQPAADAKAVKAGLADGSLRLVVGTHAVLAKGVTFRDLGLLVLDEEHRFGVKQKERLRELSAGTHTLAMSATPIPRTLRQALEGLRDVSIITTLPAERRPVRTEAVTLSDGLLRDTLRREAARGGQGFVIVPRIDDLEPMKERLGRLVPELGLVEAHGKLRPEELEDRVERFARGGCDVLLATNIVETGLDIPNANTIIVHRADRFGLAQLHQLRGRVGRSRRQAWAYLTWPEDRPPSPQGMERLHALAALTGPGAGWAVAERDMELRGGGDLLGEAQSGHVRDVGPALFQALVRDAMAAAKGETPDATWSPRIALDRPALLPPALVPEPGRRMEIYARLSRMTDPAQRDALAADLRHPGQPLPAEAEALLDLAELKLLCRRAGVESLDIGPKGAVLGLRPGVEPPAGAEVRDDGKLRVTWDDPAGRMGRVRGCWRRWP
ncbi:DEAD/DEAH box helicase [Aerophototrophica crusticola]|uniref:Transcription-repair-coupling factor n=2 Tax=Aerophototrophica crusticola TaxID=1709002 RepID=A0A858R547_9PROT|nr:DEAD/DEAH box helicase [Rhodospirillaceae bacterium B3]